MPAPRPVPAAAAPTHRGPPVWLPWVLAPGFLLLPVGGCGMAATLRRPAVAAAPAVAPVETVATVVPPRAAVAWRPTAD
jgi:hypothetical protein